MQHGLAYCLRFVAFLLLVLSLAKGASLRADEPLTPKPDADSTDPEAGWRTTGDAPEFRKYWNSIELTQAPALTSLKYMDDNFKPANALAGKVVVVAVWSSSIPASVDQLDKLKDIATQFTESDVMIAVHVAQGWGKGKDIAEQKQWPFVMAADAQSQFLGKLRPGKPLRLYVIDRKGFLRVASADPGKLLDIVRSIEAEPGGGGGFPAFTTGEQLKALDIQGKTAPKMDGFDWYTKHPVTQSKVVLIECFSPGWSGSREYIPKFNELQDRYKDDLVVVGLALGSSARMGDFVKDTKIDYSLATDRGGVWEHALAERETPYMVLISTDGIVRWQGSGMSFDGYTVTQTIENDLGVALRRLKEKKAQRDASTSAKKPVNP